MKTKTKTFTLFILCLICFIMTACVEIVPFEENSVSSNTVSEDNIGESINSDHNVKKIFSMSDFQIDDVDSVSKANVERIVEKCKKIYREYDEIILKYLYETECVDIYADLERSPRILSIATNPAYINNEYSKLTATEYYSCEQDMMFIIVDALQVVYGDDRVWQQYKVFGNLADFKFFLSDSDQVYDESKKIDLIALQKELKLTDEHFAQYLKWNDPMVDVTVRQHILNGGWICIDIPSYDTSLWKGIFYIISDEDGRDREYIFPATDGCYNKEAYDYYYKK